MRFLPYLLLVLLFCSLPACEQATDPVAPRQPINSDTDAGMLLAMLKYGDANIAVRAGGVVWAQEDGIAALDIFLVNQGPDVIAEPVNLTVLSVTPATVTLLNADGTNYAGLPHRTFEGVFGEDGLLTVAEASAPVTFTFSMGDARSFAATFRLEEDRPLGAIRGTVFSDDNIDGVRDPEEAGLQGIPVRLLSEAPDFEPLLRLTDSTGEFEYPNLPAGAYTVELGDVSTRTLTTPQQVVVVLLETEEGVAVKGDVDFGLQGAGETLFRRYNFNDGILPDWRGSQPADMEIIGGKLLMTALPPVSWRYEVLDDREPSPFSRGHLKFDFKAEQPRCFMTLSGRADLNKSGIEWGPFIYFSEHMTLEVCRPENFDTGYAYSLETWYRVRIVFNNALGERGQYDLYIQDLDTGSPEVLVGTYDYSAVTGRLYDMVQFSFAAFAEDGSTNTFHLDNVEAFLY